MPLLYPGEIRRDLDLVTAEPTGTLSTARRVTLYPPWSHLVEPQLAEGVVVRPAVARIASEYVLEALPLPCHHHQRQIVSLAESARRRRPAAAVGSSPLRRLRLSASVSDPSVRMRGRGASAAGVSSSFESSTPTPAGHALYSRPRPHAARSMRNIVWSRAASVEHARMKGAFSMSRSHLP